MADVTIEDAAKEEWDLVALPGGMPGTYTTTSAAKRAYFCSFSVSSVSQFVFQLFVGATHLKESAALTSILEKQKGAKKVITQK